MQILHSILPKFLIKISLPFLHLLLKDLQIPLQSLSHLVLLSEVKEHLVLWQLLHQCPVYLEDFIVQRFKFPVLLAVLDLEAIVVQFLAELPRKNVDRFFLPGKCSILHQFIRRRLLTAIKLRVKLHSIRSDFLAFRVD